MKENEQMTDGSRVLLLKHRLFMYKYKDMRGY